MAEFLLDMYLILGSVFNTTQIRYVGTVLNPSAPTLISSLTAVEKWRQDEQKFKVWELNVRLD